MASREDLQIVLVSEETTVEEIGCTEVCEGVGNWDLVMLLLLDCEFCCCRTEYSVNLKPMYKT